MEGGFFYDVADYLMYFLGVRAHVLNPLAVITPTADVRRPVTARVDHTVQIDFPSSDSEIAQILTEDETVYDVAFFGCIFWVNARACKPTPCNETDRRRSPPCHRTRRSHRVDRFPLFRFGNRPNIDGGGGLLVAPNPARVCHGENSRERTRGKRILGGTHIYILWVVGLIFGELCRMIDFYVGNQYVLINRRFSEYARFSSNY